MLTQLRGQGHCLRCSSAMLPHVQMVSGKWLQRSEKAGQDMAVKFNGGFATQEEAGHYHLYNGHGRVMVE